MEERPTEHGDGMTHPQRGAGVDHGPAGGNPEFLHRARERVQKSSHITVLALFIAAQLAIQRGGPTTKRSLSRKALFFTEKVVYKCSVVPMDGQTP